MERCGNVPRMTVARSSSFKVHSGIDVGVAFIALLIVFAQLAYFLHTRGQPPVTFIDADCYMRLVRVEQWAAGGAWYDNVIHASNSPYGESLHWSRPLDILILPGVFLLQPLFGFRSALLISGILISPLLEVCAVFFLAWGMVPYANRAQRLRLLMLFGTQSAVFLPFMAGRPDHHSLLSLLFIIEIALLARLSASRTFRLSHARFLGLTLALALWVSIEALVAVALALAVLGATWAYEEKSRASDAACAVFFWLLGGSFLALLLDRSPVSPHFFAFEADRISFQHVALMGLLAGGTILMKLVTAKAIDLPRGWPRLALGGGIGLGILLLIYLFIPALLASPFSQANPEAMKLWLPHVSEVQPIARLTMTSAYLFMLMLGPLLLCFPWICQRLYLPKKRGRFLCLLTALGLVLYLPLTLYQMRWGCYSGLLLIFPLSMILTEVLGDIQIRYEGMKRILLRVLITVLFLTGFMLLTAQVGTLGPHAIPPSPLTKTSSSTKGKRINHGTHPQLAQMCEWMIKNRFRLPDHPRFLNFMDDGPEILYRTGWEIIATPYHRNGQAIVDTYTILSSPPNDPAAMKILHERSPNLILIRITGAEMGCFYLGEKMSLYQALADSTPPDWAEKIDLPEPLSDYFRLYRIQSLQDYCIPH